ncbi:hypothetical protein ACIRP2_30565 [Streptomyces sp. NPDC101194]|uniref:hypothetical protein n=1 Tax=Streptomyces sp. NPDC101194 TaxID=3366127 RepID=UPI00380EA3FD
MTARNETRVGTPDGGPAAMQRPPAEVRYAEELAALRSDDRDPRPPGWESSLRAARRFVIGDAEAGISRKFVGNPSLVDRALVTLATNRGPMLVGDSSTPWTAEPRWTGRVSPPLPAPGWTPSSTS